jgi:hypothetical protein
MAGTFLTERLKGGADVLRRRSRHDVLFQRELKVGIIKHKDLWKSEFGIELDKPYMRDARSFLVRREFNDILAM